MLEHFEKQIQLCFLLGFTKLKDFKRIIFVIDVLEKVRFILHHQVGRSELSNNLVLIQE